MPRWIKADFLIEDVGRQIRRGDDFIVRHDHESLDEILKLAHVSFPSVIHQVLKRLAVNSLLLDFVFLTEASYEMLDQQRDILATLTQRGQINRDHVDTIIK